MKNTGTDGQNDAVLIDIFFFVQLVKAAVYRHLSWIVFWGSLLGAIIGVLAELASVFVRGPN